VATQGLSSSSSMSTLLFCAKNSANGIGKVMKDLWYRPSNAAPIAHLLQSAWSFVLSRGLSHSGYERLRAKFALAVTTMSTCSLEHRPVDCRMARVMPCEEELNEMDFERRRHFLIQLSLLERSKSDFLHILHVDLVLMLAKVL
jgi:hypothetical protein